MPFQTYDEASETRESAGRIAALRGLLAREGLAGFLVPLADVHQNEYLPASERRLAWLTGFTGSAGLAIILRDEASLFVDGRYTLQAAEQTDRRVITVRALADETPEAWIGRALKPGDRLGYDPSLHPLASIERFRTAAERADASLVPVDNPVDRIWTDRPPPPLAPVSAHPLEFAGEEASSKLDRLRKALAEAGADALFTADAHAVAWALNIRGGDVPHTPLPLSFLLLPKTGRPTLFIDGRKLSNAMRDDLAALADIAEPATLDAALAGLGVATVRIDANETPERFARAIEAGGGTLQKGPDLVAKLRAVKNAAEQAGSRAAHLRDGVAFARFLAWFDREAPSGRLTEIAVAEALERFRVETGQLADISFPSISAAGEHAAIPHYRVTSASNAAVTPGLFLIDSGAQYRDGTTDITRTIAVGEPTAEMADRYTRVLKGHIAIAMARFPKGTSGAQLDSFARKALWDIGADFDHGTGHGVGSYLSVHEGPQRISKLGTTPLEPGMLLSNEPGYYRAGAFGIRIENLVLVQPVTIEGAERTMHCFETVTLAPIDTRPVLPDLLTGEERGWLNAYHERVRETLSPLVDPATRDFLERACRPI